MTTKTIYTLTFCFIIGMFTKVYSQVQPLMVKIERRGTVSEKNIKIYIYIFDYETDNYQKIYENSKYNKGVTSLLISPNNRYIAARESERLSDTSYPKGKLTIMDYKGKILYTIDRDVQKLAWHPDGEILAYITGSYSEDGSWGFRPEALYAFNVKTGKEKKIEGVKYPHALQWIKGDGSAPLFIRDAYQVDGKRIIYRYDAQNEKLSPTTHKNINFSPDGKYYLQYSGEEFDKFAVYESATNKDITGKLPKTLQHHFEWGFDVGHYAMRSEHEQVMVYDVETGQVAASFNGYHYNTNSSSSTYFVPSHVVLLMAKDGAGFSIIKKQGDRFTKQPFEAPVNKE